MTTYEVGQEAFECRVIRLEGDVEIGDSIVADLGGDARARTKTGVYNDEVFSVVAILVSTWSGPTAPATRFVLAVSA